MFPPPVLPAPDVVTRAAVVEGYNSNTYQAQDNPNVPLIERHPAPFTGVDGNLELRFLGRDADGRRSCSARGSTTTSRWSPRTKSDDGAFNGILTTSLTLGKQSLLTLSESASVTSFNAAHVTDGTIFAFDPTQVRSTYWIDDFAASIGHQLSPNWRLTQSIGATVSGTHPEEARRQVVLRVDTGGIRVGRLLTDRHCGEELGLRLRRPARPHQQVAEGLMADAREPR